MRSAKFILVFLLFSTVNAQQLQLELQNATVIHAPVKLSNSGMKYYYLDHQDNWSVILQTMQLKLYNLNGTLFKTMNLPPKPDPNTSIYAIFYVSETLFDTDSTNIEYMVCWIWGANNTTKIQVVREDGTILLDEMDANTVEFYTTGKYISVFTTDQGTKMQLAYSSNGVPMGSKIFTLPGHYPIGISPSEMTIGNGFQVYPNPSSDGFKIRNAANDPMDIEVYSMDGKKVGLATVKSGEKIEDLKLSSGEYIIKATDKTSNKSVSKKIIIE